MNKKPVIKRSLYDLKYGQPFTKNDFSFTKLKPDHITTEGEIVFSIGWVSGTAKLEGFSKVELIIEPVKFKEIKPKEKFFDIHGYEYVKLDDDDDEYVVIDTYSKVNAFCIDLADMWGFSENDLVYVVVYENLGD